MAKVKIAKVKWPRQNDQGKNGQGKKCQDKNGEGKNSQGLGVGVHGKMGQGKNGEGVGKNSQGKYGQVMRHPTQSFYMSFTGVHRQAAICRSFFVQFSSSHQNLTSTRQDFSAKLPRSIAACHNNILQELDKSVEYGSDAGQLRFSQSNFMSTPALLSHFTSILAYSKLLSVIGRKLPILPNCLYLGMNLNKNIFGHISY